ncbi:MULTISPECIES: hypothetical protein [unclassified Streptomyces]|uniref:hypothetical protein n=1 Tax=unclassified Streptomyces TaxID=2593676 RepID=UPI003D8D4E58
MRRRQRRPAEAPTFRPATDLQVRAEHGHTGAGRDHGSRLCAERARVGGDGVRGPHDFADARVPGQECGTQAVAQAGRTGGPDRGGAHLGASCGSLHLPCPQQELGRRMPGALPEGTGTDRLP